MSRQTLSIALGGGVDEVSQALAVKPGRLIACLNHEAVDNGYARIEGIERFDGRPGPTDYPFALLGVALTSPLVADDLIVGEDSGASATLLVPAGADDARLCLRDVSGAFEVGEVIAVGGMPVGVVASILVEGEGSSPDTLEADGARAARDWARAAIEAVPGSGPVRGVAEFGGEVFAWRDNAGASACVAHRAGADGWEAVALGGTLIFANGSEAILDGDTITGGGSGATGTAVRVVVQSGDWDAGDAAGYIVLAPGAGAFVAETVTTAGGGTAQIDGAAVAVSFPPGGRYRFKAHNFYGAAGSRRLYGVNGVGNAFEFDGINVAPIVTGADDPPAHVAVYREHLFLGRLEGGIDHSAPLDPFNFDPTSGAGTIAVGTRLADLLAMPGALAILGEEAISVLTGTSAQDWVRDTLTDSAGALPGTAQTVTGAVYLDNRGLRSLNATQAFGNFAMGTLSNDVRVSMKRKKAAGIGIAATAVLRGKDAYRIFYDDGSGISFYMGRKAPEPTFFDLGRSVSCVSVTETESDEERAFVGCTDGFVYQIDKGTSLDGDEIGAFVQLPYVHAGSPRLAKRWMKAVLELIAPPLARIGLAVEYDYSNDEQPFAAQTQADARGGGGLWGGANFSEFYWSAPVEGAAEFWLDGMGRNASIIISSQSADLGAYVLQGLLVDYSPRGQAR